MGTWATVFKTDGALGGRVGLDKLKCHNALLPYFYGLSPGSLGYCKPFTTFENFDKVDSGNYWQVFLCFFEKMLQQSVLCHFW